MVQKFHLAQLIHNGYALQRLPCVRDSCCCSTLVTHNIHMQRGQEKIGGKEGEEREPPKVPWEYLTKMPGKPTVVCVPSRTLFGFGIPARSNRNIRLARKEKMFPSVVLPANTKRSIVPAGWCVVCQGRASLPSTGSFEDAQRAAALLAGPQSGSPSPGGGWLKMRSQTRQARGEGRRAGGIPTVGGVTASKSKGSGAKLLTSQCCDFCPFFVFITPSLEWYSFFISCKKPGCVRAGKGLIRHFIPLSHACTPPLSFPLVAFSSDLHRLYTFCLQLPP